MYPQLPKIEVVIYFALWLALYGWAIFKVCALSISNAYIRRATRDGDLEVKQEFFIPNHFKDVSDFEWELWNHWILQMIIYSYTIHFTIMRLTEIVCSKFRFHASMLFTVGFCLYFFGLKAFLYLLIQSLICFSFAYLTQSATVIWIVSIASICTFSSSYAFSQVELLLGGDTFLLVSFICSCSTSNLRYTAFCLEYCWNAKDVKRSNKDHVKNDVSLSLKQSLTDLVLYQFYFPLFTGGPIINCDDFLNQIKKKPAASWSKSFLLKFTLGICRYSFWHIFTNAFIHYFYFGSMHYDLRLMNSVPLLTLCGLGLCNVQFFCLKYIVMYGLPSKFAVSDNLEVSGASHCVSAKHKFTFMWKYFDKGLHKWLVRYIFIPMGGSNKSNGILRSTVTSLLVFAFVYLWHGLRRNHLVWAALNWFGVFIEKIADDVYKTQAVQNFEKKYLSPAMSRRIRAAISTPVFSLLIISNIYFLSGIQSTNIYMKRIYTENIFGTFLIHLVLYFGAQCSMELTRLGI